MRAIEGGKRIKEKRRSGISLHPGDAHDTTTPSFKAPAQDSEGKSEKVLLRVPPSFLRQLDLLRSNRAMGFKTVTDAGRAAMYEGLRVLAGIAQDKELSNLQVMIDTWVGLCRGQEQFLDYANVINMVTEEVNKLIAANATEKAKALVRKTLKDCKDLDDEFWSERYENQIRERFGFLLNGDDKRRKK
jgi:hypothetical protein